MLEHKSLQFKADGVSKDGRIEGYGSIFDVEDSYGDTVKAGAFAATLADLKSRGQAPKFLSEHRAGEFLGDWTEFTEDSKGLRLVGQFDLTSPLAQEKHRHAMAGRLDGLSIGFRTVKYARNEEDDYWKRDLLEVRLYEISLVTFPANEEALVDAVKAADLTDRDIEERLTRGAQLSRSVARALMRGGLQSVRAKQDAGRDDPNDIAAAIREGLRSAKPCAGESESVGMRIAHALRAELQH